MVRLVPNTGNYRLTTAEFASANQVKAQTVLKRFCETGSYFGAMPQKLANGRLAWPDVQVVQQSFEKQVA